MERYTYFDGGKWRLRAGDTEYSGPWVDRLAAYEDTGLEPEDFKKAFNEDAVVKLAAQALGTTPYRLRELVKAQHEGLVVVLATPRKPLVWGDDDHETCLCPDCGADLMGIPYGERMILQCPVCGQYVDTTEAITRAEAEAAQREEGQDDPPKD